MTSSAGATTNLDGARLRETARTAGEIFDWSAEMGHPEKFEAVAAKAKVRDFLYTLDLLETVLKRFGICSELCSVALKEMDRLPEENSLFWSFWQIDVEEFFASSLLELSYQLSEAWRTLERFGREDAGFRVLKAPFQKPDKVLMARHKFTHFQPSHFEDHHLAEEYSILRRPYRIVGDRLEKELAKETMPRVASLVRASVDVGHAYLQAFHAATVG